MTDEFLHALRRDPPPQFARELKRRLNRLPARRSAWSSVARTMLATLLIGGVAIAAVVLLGDRREPVREAAPVAKAIPPKVAARAAPPASPPPADRQVSNDRNPLPQLQEPEPEDIPVAFVSSQLARPLADALAERLAQYGPFARTRVMTMEDNEAFRSLCGSADFIMVSRRIADAELAQCRRWGIDVLEWKLGYQAVVLAAAPTTDLPALAPRDVFHALARRIPDPAEPSRLIDNPNVSWHDIDGRFDYRDIDVLAPPDATTRALFAQLVMEPGCETYPWIRALKATDRPRYDDICHQLRGDGRYREVELTNTVVSQQLWGQPNWLLVLRYSYYDTYRTDLSAMLEGAAPSLATLTDGSYAAARPVYVYGQSSHVNWSVGTRMLARELTAEHAIGPYGYLPRRGLVLLDEVERRKQRQEHTR